MGSGSSPNNHCLSSCHSDACAAKSSKWTSERDLGFSAGDRHEKHQANWGGVKGLYRRAGQVKFKNLLDSLQAC